MKKRGGEEGGGGGGGPEHTTMKKTRKRLGGKGLSLDAFVGANRVKPAVVTASQIRKQREAYQNSKKVNKYRKTLKHLAEEGHEFRPRVPLSLSNVDDVDVDAEVSGGQGAGPQGEEASAAGGETGGAEKGGQRKKRLRQPKPVSHLERLREEYETKKQEEEEVRREKRALFEEQQAAREKSKQERKGVQKKFRKATGKGQPVMKHRMEHLLDSIQKDMNTSR